MANCSLRHNDYGVTKELILGQYEFASNETDPFIFDENSTKQLPIKPNQMNTKERDFR